MCENKCDKCSGNTNELVLILGENLCYDCWDEYTEESERIEREINERERCSI